MTGSTLSRQSERVKEVISFAQGSEREEERTNLTPDNVGH